MVRNGASIHLSGFHIRFNTKLSSFFETISLERVFAMSQRSKLCGIFPDVNLTILENLLKEIARKENHTWIRKPDTVGARRGITEKLTPITSSNSTTSPLLLERSYISDPSIYRREDPYTTENWHFLSAILCSCTETNQHGHTPYSLGFTLTSRSFLRNMEDYRRLLKICSITDEELSRNYSQRKKEVKIQLSNRSDVVKATLNLNYVKGYDEPFLYSTLDVEFSAESAILLLDNVTALFRTLHPEYSPWITMVDGKQYTKAELEELLFQLGHNVLPNHRFRTTDEGFVISNHEYPSFVSFYRSRNFKIGQSKVMEFKDIDNDRKFKLEYAKTIGNKNQAGLVARWV